MSDPVRPTTFATRRWARPGGALAGVVLVAAALAGWNWFARARSGRTEPGAGGVGPSGGRRRGPRPGQRRVDHAGSGDRRRRAGGSSLPGGRSGPGERAARRRHPAGGGRRTHRPGRPRPADEPLALRAPTRPASPTTWCSPTRATGSTAAAGSPCCWAMRRWSMSRWRDVRARLRALTALAVLVVVLLPAAPGGRPYRSGRERPPYPRRAGDGGSRSRRRRRAPRCRSTVAFSVPARRAHRRTGVRAGGAADDRPGSRGRAHRGDRRGRARDHGGTGRPADPGRTGR